LLQGVCEVEGGAPAATPYAIVFFDYSLEVVPCRGLKFSD